MATVSILDESKIKNVFHNQGYLDFIVAMEKGRLEKQEGSINGALNSQKRLMGLNDSFRKRYNEYIKIFVVVLISLILIFGVVLLEANFPVIPSSVTTILVSLIVATAIILILIFVSNIYSRERTDFDKLDLGKWYFGSGTPDGIPVSVGSGSGSSIGSSNVEIGYKTCEDDSCCDVGTRWCENTMQCIGNAQWSKLCSSTSFYDPLQSGSVTSMVGSGFVR